MVLHPKLDWAISDFENAIGVASLENAAFFLDTNVLTKDLEPALWNALCTRRVLITPGVWKELLPWLKTPFCNETIRNAVLVAAESQVKRAGGVQDSWAGIEVLFLDQDLRTTGITIT
jgi:hypothetical protein